jgi:hypothetical protein
MARFNKYPSIEETEDKSIVFPLTVFVKLHWASEKVADNKRIKILEAINVSIAI